jgi:hypothetical protein
MLPACIAMIRDTVGGRYMFIYSVSALQVILSLLMFN